jgi:hypothetical protein
MKIGELAKSVSVNIETVRYYQRIGLLELSSSDCSQVEELAAKQLNMVRAKLRQLHRIESMLAKTVEQCAKRKANRPCPILETITEGSESVLTFAIRLKSKKRAVCSTI